MPTSQPQPARLGLTHGLHRLTSLARVLAKLPGGHWLRVGFRTLQTWGHYTSFRAWHQLLGTPALRPLAQRHPRLAYKYLVPSLAGGLSRAIRLRIVHYHYAYWATYARPDFFHLVLQPHEVWQCTVEHQRYSIALAYPFESDFEGELSLRFYADAVWLYTVTFTLVPAETFPLTTASPALLVSRVQGTRQVDLIRQATKHLHECPPPVLLLQALAGLSQACAIPSLVGVGTTAQPSAHKSNCYFDYDHFWQQLGAVPFPMGSAFYGLHWLSPDKPVTARKAHHRARTARKRAYKQQVRSSIQHYVGQHLLLVACGGKSNEELPVAPASALGLPLGQLAEQLAVS